MKQQHLFGGRYRVLKKLGSGQTGTVFLVAEEHSDDRLLALKSIHTNRLKEGDGDQFQLEFGRMASLQHPNLVTVYDYGRDTDDRFFFTMEYVPGKPIGEWAGQLDEKHVCDWLIQICQGLACIHDRGLVHLDIKSDNILVDENDRIKITDLGLMSLLLPRQGTHLQGTPDYIAPEIVQAAAVDHRADLYSLGVLLYLLTTGRLPFQSDSVADLLKAHVQNAPQPPLELKPQLPSYLNSLILHLLAKNPDDRPRSASAIIIYLNDQSAFDFSAQLPAHETLTSDDSESKDKEPRYFTLGQFQELDDTEFESTRQALEFDLETDQDSGREAFLAADLANSGYYYLQYNNPQQAIETIHKSILLNQRIGDVKGLALAYNTRGEIYLELGKIEEARQALTTALELSERHQIKRGLIEVNHNLGRLFWIVGDMQAALRHQQANLELVTDTDPHLITRVHQYLTQLYRNLANYEKAIDHARQGLVIAQKTGHLADRVHLHFEWVALHFQLNDLEGVAQQLKFARNAFTNQPIASRLVRKLRLMLDQWKSRYLIEQHNWIEARYLIEQTLSGFALLKDPLEENRTRLILARLMFTMGDRQGARKLLDEIFSFIESPQGNELQARYYMLNSHMSLSNAEAESDLMIARREAEQREQMEERWMILHLLGELAHQQDQYRRATDYYQQAIAIVRKIYESVPEKWKGVYLRNRVRQDLRTNILRLNRRKMPISLAKKEFYFINDTTYFDVNLHTGQDTPAVSSLTDRLQSWAALYEITSLFNYAVLDFDMILTTIIDRLIDLSGANRGILILLDRHGGMTFRIGRDRDRQNLQPNAMKISHSLVGMVLEAEQALCFPDIQRDHKLRHSDSINDLGIMAALCVPLKVILREDEGSPLINRRRISLPYLDRIIGFIYMDCRSISESYSDDDLKLFQTFANIATSTLIKEKLFQQATTDSTTQIHNRTFLEQNLRDELRIARQTQTPVAFILGTIDFYHQIIDRYGHQTLDGLLKKLAMLLKAGLRTRDIAAYFGGDLFAFVLPQTDLKGAQTVIEQIQQRLKEKTFLDNELKITMSFGVSVYPAYTESPHSLIRSADQALYQAQNEGGHTYRVWNPDMTRPARRVDQLSGILSGDSARNYRNVSVLLDTLTEMNAAPTFEELTRISVKRFLDITSMARGYLLMPHLADTASEAFQIRVALDRYHDEIGFHLTELDDIIRTVAREMTPVYLTEEPTSDILIEAQFGLSLPDDRKTVLALPMIVRRRIVAIIYVDSEEKLPHFDQYDVIFFEALAGQMAIAIANAQLAKKSSEAENLAHIGQMTSMIIHDFKNPMSIINCLADMLRQSELRTEQVQEMGGQISTAARRISEMLKELLNFSRGESELATQRFDLSSFFRTLIDVHNNQWPTDHVEFKISGEPVWIEADYEKLERVILNLINNACEAMERKGTITIHYQPIADKEIDIRISDSGPGIPNDILHTLFNPFVTGGKNKGTGLGLAIARRIIEMHRGKIWVENHKDLGTTFFIRIPQTQ